MTTEVLSWAQRCVKTQRIVSVDAPKNFTKDFVDGKVFCALFAHVDEEKAAKICALSDGLARLNAVFDAFLEVGVPRFFFFCCPFVLFLPLADCWMPKTCTFNHTQTNSRLRPIALRFVAAGTQSPIRLLSRFPVRPRLQEVPQPRRPSRNLPCWRKRSKPFERRLQPWKQISSIRRMPKRKTERSRTNCEKSLNQALAQLPGWRNKLRRRK